MAEVVRAEFEFQTVDDKNIGRLLALKDVLASHNFDMERAQGFSEGIQYALGIYPEGPNAVLPTDEPDLAGVKQEVVRRITERNQPTN